MKPIPSKAGLTVEVAIGGQPLVMELNTRALVSIVSEGTWTKVLKGWSLQPSPIWLKTYTGQSIKVLGQQVFWVEYEGQRHKLPLVVVAGDGPSLFRCNWLESIRLDWGSIKTLTSELDELLNKHQDFFRKELCTPSFASQGQCRTH